MAAYQAQAVDPHVTPLDGHAARGRADRSAARRRLRRQRRAPGPPGRAHRVDGRRRRRRERSRSPPIPTSTCSTSATARRTRRSSSSRYRAAQIARNNAITDWAETELKRVRAAGFSDRPFTVMRTWADPRMVDPTIEPTKRQPNMCYAGVPVKANRSAHGIAAACTLRNWLGMWSLRHAQTRAEPHLARITCPALVINAEAGHRRVPVGRPAHLRRAGQHRQDRSARSTPTTTSPPRARAASRPTPSPSGSPSGGAEGPRPLRSRRQGAGFPCTRIGLARHPLVRRGRRRRRFYRELPEAEVIWHVLRPLSGADLRAGDRLRLVHKLGAGVNTIDVDTATRTAASRWPTCPAPTRRRWPRARCC